MPGSRIAVLCACLPLTACGGGTSPAAPSGDDSAVTSIPDVQGFGPESPLDGQTVTIAGIVTGDFQDNDADTASNLGGFFVQEESPDGNVSTSDGIFVYDGSKPGTAISVGDRVRVTGSVKEHFGETQIAASRVVVIGRGDIEPTDLELPETAVLTNSDGDTIANFERYEGLHNIARYGEVTLSQGGRLYQYTNGSLPSVPGYRAHRKLVATRSILLDDGRRDRNAKPIRYLESADPIRVGSEVTALTGTIRFSRGSGAAGVEAYRLMPVGQPRFKSAELRARAPGLAGSLRIASFNVSNFFSTIDEGRNICGPAGDSNCRGADSRAEFDRQLVKIVAALTLLGADVIGLVELENNAFESLRAIADALNDALGKDTYSYVETGTIGSDAIKTGFLYKPRSVSTQGAFAVLDSSVDAHFNDALNRPALAQTFREARSDAALTVVLNHLKSKSSSCDSDGDPNLGDGQGECSRTRNSAAEAIVRWLATDPTASGDPDFLIMGGLNAYLKEDPVITFEKAGFTNLIAAATGSEPYSFIFDNQSGALDHALASPTLVAQVAGAIEWHINADESAAFDYNLDGDRDPAMFDPETPYRAADHDPVIIGLDLHD
jgi:predicted extracellular nuclease